MLAKSGEEELRAPAFLDALAALAGRAGGAAPLPPHPDTLQIEELRRLSGTEQLGAILEQRAGLEEEIRRWSELAERARRAVAIVGPRHRFAATRRQHRRRRGHPARVHGDRDAALSARRDRPLAPLVAKLAAVLRQALTTLRDELSVAVEAANATLANDATWAKLDVPTQDAIRREVGLDAPPALVIDTDIALRRALDERPLPAWRSDIDAVEAASPTRWTRRLRASSQTIRIALGLR